MWHGKPHCEQDQITGGCSPIHLWVDRMTIHGNMNTRQMIITAGNCSTKTGLQPTLFYRITVSTDFYAYKVKPSRKRLRKLLFFFAIAIGSVGAIVGIYNIALIVSKKSQQTISVIASLWGKKAYNEVLQTTNTLLVKDPLNPYLLMYNGFASFYLSIPEYDIQKKTVYIQNTIRTLRKIFLIDKFPYLDTVYYILGKAYFFTGPYFYDLSLKYFNEALALRFNSLDIYEYRGLIQAYYGNYTESISNYLLVLEKKNKSPELLYALAHCYLNLNDSMTAEEYLLKAEMFATDVFTLEQIYLSLADIYLQRKNTENFFATIEKIKKSNPESAEAYYREGLYYSMQGDIIRARAAWRKVLNLDPMHKEARQKLANR